VEKSSLATRVVCDAGPLIHLQDLESLELLADFAAVLVPDAVWAEVQRHQPRALEVSTVQLSRTSDPSPIDPKLDTLGRGLALAAGELAAIALAQQESECVLLTDDAAARLAAESLGLRVHGTIGVILRSLRTGRQTPAQVIALLESIPVRSTLYVRKHLLDEAIQQVRKQYPE
jgi:predicted nucleic acid-binding protein